MKRPSIRGLAVPVPNQSRYIQGCYHPGHFKKLIDPNTPVVFRSSWEIKFITWCEISPQVVKWGSECVRIPYVMPDGTHHTYYPDFYIETNDDKKIIIEIKPLKETREPHPSASEYAKKTYIKNRCKWAAAQQYCTQRGLSFKIITEATISRIGS